MKTLIILLVSVLNISFVLSNENVVINKPVIYGKAVKECPKENTGGVLVVIEHETDCDKFYVCIDGEKVLQDCPDGLHFDPKHGNCNWPDEVNCKLTSPRPSSTESTSQRPSSTSKGTRPPTTTSRRPSSTSKATLPPTTTSQKPSSTSKATPPPTTSSQKPSSTSKATRPPTTTSQKPSSTSKATLPPTTTSRRPSSTSKATPPPTTTSRRPSSTSKATAPPTTTSRRPNSTEPTTTQKPTTTKRPRPTSCPKNDTAKPVLLPHECVCNKYYLCRRGEQILRRCPSGLHFNPDDQDCELPEEAGCMKPTPTPTPTPPIPTECPKLVGPESVHIAHERNCSLFYTCTPNGGKIVQECPAGLYFNPKLQICDWPYNVNCTNKPPLSTSTKNPWKPTTTTKRPWKPTTTTKKPWHVINKREVDSGYHWESSSEATTTTKRWQNPDTCIGKCPWRDPKNDTVQLPNIRCDKFCKCSNGRAYVIPCPAKLHYNVQLKVCDWPQNAKCTGIGGITTTTGKPSSSSSKRPVGSSTGKPNSSSKKPEISTGKPKPEAQPPTIFQRLFNAW